MQAHAGMQQLDALQIPASTGELGEISMRQAGWAMMGAALSLMPPASASMQGGSSPDTLLIIKAA